MTTISIHAPRVGSDGAKTQAGALANLFQSTLPVWGATPTGQVIHISFCYFNPRSPCGERPYKTANFDAIMQFQSTLPVWGATPEDFYRVAELQNISIHAPRVGSDWTYIRLSLCVSLFQSTLPVWGATSISMAFFPGMVYFNPRSPCGERPFFRSYCIGHSHISIHAPRVGSDFLLSALREVLAISIHAPRVGSDFCIRIGSADGIEFQSTLPVWGATAKLHNSSPAILRKSDNSLLFLPDFHRPDNFMEHTSAP